MIYFYFYITQSNPRQLRSKIEPLKRLESMFIAKHDKSVSNGSSSQSRYHRHRYRTGIYKLALDERKYVHLLRSRPKHVLLKTKCDNSAWRNREDDRELKGVELLQHHRDLPL